MMVSMNAKFAPVPYSFHTSKNSQRGIAAGRSGGRSKALFSLGFDINAVSPENRLAVQTLLQQLSIFLTSPGTIMLCAWCCMIDAAELVVKFVQTTPPRMNIPYASTSPNSSVHRPSTSSRCLQHLARLLFIFLSLPTFAEEAGSITFIAASDTHFKVPYTQNDGKRVILAGMNQLAGKKFPASLKGETIGKPLGVMVAGDLIDGGRDAKAQLELWTRDFGLTGTDGAVLKLPVYETWGNHDGGNLVPEAIAARNKNRVGLVAASPAGGEGPSYSWDWGSLHLVSVGMYPGNAVESEKHHSPSYDPRKSLEFLTNDLAKAVGNSRRPVVVMQHFNLPNDSDEWWTAAQRDAYLEVLRNYNVVTLRNNHGKSGTLDFALNSGCRSRVAFRMWGDPAAWQADGAQGFEPEAKSPERRRPAPQTLHRPRQALCQQPHPHRLRQPRHPPAPRQALPRLE